jgi:hypothetical protein
VKLVKGKVGKIEEGAGGSLTLRLEDVESGQLLEAEADMAVLATGMMLMGFLNLACGLILDTVTRGRREIKRMQYLRIPKLDPENQSKLNCIIAELHLDDGLVFPEVLGLDTTTLRMVGEGGINLQENTIDLTLTPFPKNPQILSIEAPVSITGTLTEPSIEMGALPVTRTIGRMAKNLILFPIKVIANDELPEDGSDICACASNYSPNPEAKGALIPGQEPNTREDIAPPDKE